MEDMMMTEQTIETIYNLFLSGNSIAIIAKEMDLKKDEVKAIVEQKYYISSRRPKGIQSVAELRELAKTHTAEELAEHYNICICRIYDYLREYGIKAYRKSRAGKGRTAKTTAILEDLKSGQKYTYEELAKKYGTSRQYIHKVSLKEDAHK